jgi:hypothetical protein
LRPLILGWGAETGFPVIVVTGKGRDVSFFFLELVRERFTYGVDEDGRDCWAMMMMMMLGWRGESLLVVDW